MLAHRVGEIAVRGGDDPDVDRHRPGAADAVDHALLNGAQQLGLQPHVHFGDFVEQQRAAIGLLEFADAARHRAGKRALLVAEQLGFEQRFRDGRAVDANERLLGPVRARVHIARQHFLAGARFAGDQNRGVARRDLQRKLDHARHRLVAIDEFTRVVGDGGQHRGDQFRVRRQRDVLFRACLDGGDRGAGIGRGAAGDDRRVDMLGFQCGHQVADGDGDIDHQEIGAAPGSQHGHRLRDVRSVGDRRAPIHRELGRGGELAVESANDQEPHGLFPSSVAVRRSRMASGERRTRVIRFPPLFAIRHSLFACSPHQPRSALMISVMVTPSFSSTRTTSPRATRRLLT